MVRRFGVGRIIEAEDGLDCLDKIVGVVPDLIISDVSMPRMDGVQLTKHIRNLDEFADVPILIQTGSVGIDKHLSCFNAGASDVLTKPLRPSELRARMRVHLVNRRLVFNLRKADQRIMRELEGARRMQTALMPKPQRLQEIKEKYGLSIEGVVNPSFSIGGDFWGVIDVDDYSVGIYTVDFSGHGVMSALNTFRMHAVISEITANHKDPAAFLTLLNAVLVGVLPRGQYATFFYAVIDTLRGTITWSGAGAPFPVLLRPDVAHSLDTTGTPLGLVGEARYINSASVFPQGCGLFVYSDGMMEAESLEGGVVGEVRDLLPNGPCEQISLDDILGHFYGKAKIPLQDDLTAIWIRNDGGIRRHVFGYDRDQLPQSAECPENPLAVEREGFQTPALLIDLASEENLAKALAVENLVVEIGDGNLNLSMDDVLAVKDGAILVSLTTKTAYKHSPCSVICKALEARGWLLASQHEDVLLALQEAMANAVIHGNLELASPTGGGAIIREYWDVLRVRLEQDEFNQRRITIVVQMQDATLVIALSDQGPGFDKTIRFGKGYGELSGRGESLMTTLASTVDWADGGRKVILTFAVSDHYV